VAYPSGIDVSNNQGSIDWDAVKVSGVQFAICKASEGTWFKDAWFGEFWSECRRLGIARGAYHFARPSTCRAVDEAEYFLRAIDELYGPLEVGDVLALDLEDPYAVGDLSSWTLEWLSHVESRAGYKPLVYTSPSYAQMHQLGRQPAIGQFGCWLASWGVPTPPPAPAPWSLVAVHQIGVAPAGVVPGVAGECDVDRFNGSSIEQFKLYGMPADAAPQPTPPPSELPVYDWTEPSRLQETDADCAVESIEWCMFSWGRTPDDDWLEQSMYAAGVWNPTVGCTDASGQGLASWVNTEYGEFGYVASAQSTDFNTLADEAATHKHPIAAGGAQFYHWVGVRSYDPQTDTLLLANPAPGWMQVGDVLPRWRFEELGPWHMVRVTHPAAENWVEPDPEPIPPDPEPVPPPVTTGAIGSGLLSMMAEDLTEPAQAASMWIGGPPADVEECYGENGVLYVWLLRTNAGYRVRPS